MSTTTPSSPGSDSNKIKFGRVVDKLCDEIESLWLAGKTPDVSLYANNLEDDAIPLFLKEILRLEYDVRPKQIPYVRERYKTLFPGHHACLEGIISEIETEIALDVTRATSRGKYSVPPAPKCFVGKKIGQYLVEKKLGGGGFGVVYMGRDPYLPRNVVIKIPLLGRVGGSSDIESFLDEARNAAMLNHPNILRVHHVGVDEGMPYIVQEYFDGGDLSHALQDRKFTVAETVSLISKLAETIAHAHESKIVHRDLKPSNILIDENGDPVIADFGLSLKDPQLYGRKGEMVGTLRFMSPEQIRGEAHRLDGRTDIWSIGVILYLMLTEQYPFDSSESDEIGNLILFGRPCPLRQLNRNVSQELERICLRCLSVRINDRYSNGHDLADDLRRVADGTNGRPIADNLEIGTRNSSLIPKGLNAFDQTDHEFFVHLLPGPKDHLGIPDSVRFWKERIENPSLSNPTNLIFGPSGCGKSSLVKAGLIPLLGPQMVVVHVESTAEDTEVRILKALRAEVPSIPVAISLPDAIVEIRRGNFLPSNRRLLIVIDQFEQWLHANPIDEHLQLIDALRQCDGDRIQTLILAREDFWMAITRFFRQLEIELVERQNFTSVDLFSRRHAKVVLTKYGQAFGCLPKDQSDFSKSQNQFLNGAINLLAENDSVICVRSALFAETVKKKPWEVDTLKKFSNSKSIGIEFLEQSLGDRASNPKYRYHREQLIAVLEALLPSTGVNIKGQLASKNTLAKAAGFNSVNDDFEKVVGILDSELRLITPTEPDSGISSDSPDDACYQLTHDYLVPSIRDWIESVRGRTIQGRSLLRVNELSEQWKQNYETRFLPGFLEYTSMIWNMPWRQTTDQNRRYLWSATQYFGLRLALVAVILSIVASFVIGQMREDRISQMLNCNPLVLQSITDSTGFAQGSYARRLLNRIEQGRVPERLSLRAQVVLALLDHAKNEDLDLLLNSISRFEDEESQNLFAALATKPDYSKSRIREILESPASNTSTEIRDKLLIFMSFLEPDKPIELLDFSPNPGRRSEFIHQFKTWQGDLSRSLDMFKAATADGQIHGLCLMFGQVPSYQFDDFNLILEHVEDLYVNHPNSAVCGAAKWAIHNWSEKLPVIPPYPANSEKNWWVNSSNMSMILVKSGRVPVSKFVTPNQNLIEHDFYISDTEVTHEQFAMFMADPDADKPIDLHLDKTVSAKTAVIGVVLEDAMLFCNWLSKTNNLRPAYIRKDDDRFVGDKDNLLDFDLNAAGWNLDPTANGYRLPLQSEWTMAARANFIETPFYYHEDPSFPGGKDYVWGLTNTRRSIQEVAKKMPNPLGLFDILGNATEFVCVDVASNLEIDEYFLKYLWSGGGSYTHEVNRCRIIDSTDRLSLFFVEPGKRRDHEGFRVVLPKNKPN